MKQFACGDVVPGCDATWTRNSTEEILGDVAEHARVVHGMTEIPDDVVQAVQSRIVTVA